MVVGPVCGDWLVEAGDFVDWSSDRLPAPLAQPASGGWWVTGLVAGVLLVSGSLFLYREDRHRGSNILPRYISYGGGVVGLVAAIGIALTRHVSGFALVAAPLVALFVGFLWFPLDLAAACFVWIIVVSRVASGRPRSGSPPRRCSSLACVRRCP